MSEGGREGGKEGGREEKGKWKRYFNEREKGAEGSTGLFQFLREREQRFKCPCTLCMCSLCRFSLLC